MQGETRGREQDFAEISRRMYEEIRSSRDPRDHVEETASASPPPSGGRPRLVADHIHKKNRKEQGKEIVKEFSE